MSACVWTAACVCVGTLSVSNAMADNPLRFVSDDQPSTMPDADYAEPVDRMPIEVQRAIYQNGPSRAKIHYDPAVEPASHVTPFQVRPLPAGEANPRVAAIEPTNVLADSRNDLEMLGSALNALQQHETQPPAQRADPTPNGPIEPAYKTMASPEPVGVANHWEREQTNSEIAPMPAAIPAVTEEPVADSSAPPVATKSLTPGAPQFRKIIERIALSTCLVLCGGVGFILVAKQVLKKKTVDREPASNSIQIKSQLQLSPKANLFLVETGKHRMIVASDQNGIRSVMPLTDSFSETLESFAQEEASEANLAAEPSFAEAMQEQASPGKLPPEMYSLATVGQRVNRNAGAGQAKPEPRTPSKIKTNKGTATTSPAEAEVRRKMEEALRDRGLKDLLMQSLQAKAA